MFEGGIVYLNTATFSFPPFVAGPLWTGLFFMQKRRVNRLMIFAIMEI